MGQDMIGIELDVLLNVGDHGVLVVHAAVTLGGLLQSRDFILCLLKSHFLSSWLAQSGQ